MSALTHQQRLPWQAIPIREVLPVSQCETLEELIGRLQSGDGSALEPLIASTQDRAWAVAYSILQNRQEVEDALQDAYLTVYEKLHQLEHPQAFWAWFKRILVHRCLRQQRRPGWEPLEADEEVSPSEMDPATRLDVADAFQSLGLKDRTVLALREILDLPYEEMSRLLEVPLNTVRTRLHHARARFHRLVTGGKSR